MASFGYSADYADEHHNTSSQYTYMDYNQYYEDGEHDEGTHQYYDEEGTHQYYDEEGTQEYYEEEGTQEYYEEEEHDEEMAAEDVTPEHDQYPNNAGMELSFAVAPDLKFLNETLYSEEEIVGMQFDSMEEAHEWYKDYAAMVGFGVRLENSKHFDRERKFLKAKLFVCSREGERKKELVERKGRQRRHIDNTRCLCKARFRIARRVREGPFFVTHFQPIHEHELLASHCSSKLRSHRKVKDFDIEYIQSLKEVGISVASTFQLMVHQAGSYGNTGYEIKDVYNKISYLKKLNFYEGDAQEALLYIDSLGRTHHGVYRSYVLGEESQLQSLFWCDRRSQVDYLQFGDVLVFDTTYKTNIYQKPLVILSGVNNHYQTTVFAAAILNDETTPTYKWVLACLMEAMDGKKPVSVITDGDLAMRSAIESVFPEAKHRLCAWHLCRNAEGNLKRGPDFMKDFMKVMKGRTNPEQWHKDWEAMVHKWRLKKENWIKMAFTCRYLWAETFLQYSFWAGQTTTSRCESINSFFKKFICFDNKLIDVCKGVMRGLAKLRNNERTAHTNTAQSDPVLTTGYECLEEHASKIYTRIIYRKFEEQASKAPKYSLHHVIHSSSKPIVAYILCKGGKRRTMQVVRALTDFSKIHCSCARYETSHMVCKHMLFVLHMKGFQKIPQCLISQRWLRSDLYFYANEPCMKEPIVLESDYNTLAFRRGSMKGHLDVLNNYGCQSQATFDFLRDHIAKGMETLKIMVKSEQEAARKARDTEENPYRHVQNPSPQETRPKGSKKSSIRRCSNCKKTGHYKTSCTEAQSQPNDDSEVSSDDSEDSSEPPFELYD